MNGLGAKGTVVKPFNGGTLSLAGNALAGEGPRGGTACFFLRAATGGRCYCLTGDTAR
jgi:hypothetical protein